MLKCHYKAKISKTWMSYKKSFISKSKRSKVSKVTILQFGENREAKIQKH
jgi:hypothetical protein